VFTPAGFGLEVVDCFWSTYERYGDEGADVFVEFTEKTLRNFIAIEWCYKEHLLQVFERNPLPSWMSVIKDMYMGPDHTLPNGDDSTLDFVRNIMSYGRANAEFFCDADPSTIKGLPEREFSDMLLEYAPQPTDRLFGMTGYMIKRAEGYFIYDLCSYVQEICEGRRPRYNHHPRFSFPPHQVHVCLLKEDVKRQALLAEVIEVALTPPGVCTRAGGFLYKEAAENYLTVATCNQQITATVI
jgi:hypothetical protein